mmetsp:Transcript_19020/g.71951  ORF Transcript_19020/g.71951 Transcript_19020/m.71951 type:complete len:370 (-) Transcript_19020:632-1741(-)
MSKKEPKRSFRSRFWPFKALSRRCVFFLRRLRRCFSAAAAFSSRSRFKASLRFSSSIRRLFLSMISFWILSSSTPASRHSTKKLEIRCIKARWRSLVLPFVSSHRTWSASSAASWDLLTALRTNSSLCFAVSANGATLRTYGFKAAISSALSSSTSSSSSRKSWPSDATICASAFACRDPPDVSAALALSRASFLAFAASFISYSRPERIVVRLASRALRSDSSAASPGRFAASRTSDRSPSKSNCSIDVPSALATSSAFGVYPSSSSSPSPPELAWPFPSSSQKAFLVIISVSSKSLRSTFGLALSVRISGFGNGLLSSSSSGLRSTIRMMKCSIVGHVFRLLLTVRSWLSARRRNPWAPPRADVPFT